jgi:hypothetical protein
MGYIYVKEEIKPPRVHHSHPKIEMKHKKVIASSLFVIGVLFLLSAVVPILQYQIEYSIKFNQVLSPLSNSFSASGSILGESGTDFTQLSNWFVTDQSNLSQVTDKKTQYLISIPKIKITDAVVEVGSLDLKKSLIQYPQTALPGQFGSPVIFGHSVLPQFLIQNHI